MFYIPTYKDCIEIVKENPEMYFYERRYNIDSYKLSIFGYRYASYNNFMLPIINKPNINALELKGISYVFDDNDEVFNHHLMLHKFWELDQYEHSKYKYFKDKRIKNITTKEDGFLITFIMLPSGDIISQTKRGYDLEENLKANEYLDNKYYYEFISYCLNNNIQPIFELVGDMRYVEYENEELILIKLRCNKTGKYLNINDFNIKNISIVKEYNYTFDELLNIKEKIYNLEGWIVQFENDDMLKIKTDWWIKQKNIKKDEITQIF